jgi:hypothetical protein
VDVLACMPAVVMVVKPTPAALTGAGAQQPTIAAASDLSGDRCSFATRLFESRLGVSSLGDGPTSLPHQDLSRKIFSVPTL